MAGFTSLIGAGVGLLGNMMQKDSADKALSAANSAAQWQPTDIYGGNLGSFTARPGGGYNMTASDLQNQLGGAFGNAALSALGNQGFAQGFMNQGGFGLPGSFDAYNAALGQQLPMAQMGMQNAYLQNIMGQTGGYGAAGLGAGMMGMGQIGNAFGMGQGLLGQANTLFGQAGNQGQLIQDRYDLMSQQAAPGEERAYNSLQNRLFSQGRLGSTGGSRDIEAFARGLGEADLSRQMAAQNLGLQAQQQMAQQAGMMGQLGSGLFGQGFQSAGQFGGMGLDALGQGANYGQTALGNIMNMQDVGISRAGQRMQNYMNLFGFGQDAMGGNLNNAVGAMGGYNQAYAPLMDMANISMRGSEGQGIAGREQARILSQQQTTGGMLGGALSQFGGALFNGAFQPRQPMANGGAGAFSQWGGIPMAPTSIRAPSGSYGLWGTGGRYF